MTAVIIDGKAIAKDIRLGLRSRTEFLSERGITPKLAVVLVGNDPASEIYVRNKGKAAAELGIIAEVNRLPADADEVTLVSLVKRLNADDTVHGIIVQLPLPPHLDPRCALSHIDHRKEVDGDACALIAGAEGFIACTPKGIIKLIESTGTAIEGKSATVIGRSSIVGKPAALLLMRYNATVTICHSKTPDLGVHTRTADILVSAVGKHGLITADMIKPGAVVIDVGMSRVDGKWKGDVDFDAALSVASYITPVPGGVGPMTIAMLMENTVIAAEACL